MEERLAISTLKCLAANESIEVIGTCMLLISTNGAEKVGYAYLDYWVARIDPAISSDIEIRNVRADVFTLKSNKPNTIIRRFGYPR